MITPLQDYLVFFLTNDPTQRKTNVKNYKENMKIISKMRSIRRTNTEIKTWNKWDEGPQYVDA